MREQGRWPGAPDSTCNAGAAQPGEASLALLSQLTTRSDTTPASTASRARTSAGRPRSARARRGRGRARARLHDRVPHERAKAHVQLAEQHKAAPDGHHRRCAAPTMYFRNFLASLHLHGENRELISLSPCLRHRVRNVTTRAGRAACSVRGSHSHDLAALRALKAAWGRRARARTRDGQRAQREAQRRRLERRQRRRAERRQRRRAEGRQRRQRDARAVRGGLCCPHRLGRRELVLEHLSGRADLTAHAAPGHMLRTVVKADSNPCSPIDSKTLCRRSPLCRWSALWPELASRRSLLTLKGCAPPSRSPITATKRGERCKAAAAC